MIFDAGKRFEDGDTFFYFLFYNNTKARHYIKLKMAPKLGPEAAVGLAGGSVLRRTSLELGAARRLGPTWCEVSTACGAWAGAPVRGCGRRRGRAGVPAIEKFL
jgi:hypothetical protein